MATKFVNTDLKVYRGDREVYRFTVTENNGQTKDLSGHTIRAQGRDGIESVSTNFDFTLVDLADGNDFANGIVVLVLPPSVTSQLAESTRYDIEAVFGDEKFTLVRGRLLLTLDVTR